MPLSLLSLAVPAVCASQVVGWAGPADAHRIVSRCRGVFTAPPLKLPTQWVPTDAPLIGNGDVGVAIGGPPERLRFFVGKNDFWSRSKKSVQTVGGVEVSIARLAGASYRMVQGLYAADVTGEFAVDGVTVRTRTWVSARRNALVTTLELEGRRAVEVTVRVWAGHLPAPGPAEDSGYPPGVPPEPLPSRAGSGDGLLWVTRRAEPEGQAGRAAAIAVGTVGAGLREHGATGTDAQATFTLHPGLPVSVCAAVAGGHDTGSAAVGPLAAARRALRGLSPETVNRWLEAHRAWWAAFWERSYVEIGDPVIEAHYYGSLYLMACCSRDKAFAPGLFGNWITTDKPMWCGDYHLNYNHQAPWWGVFSSNRADLADPYDTPLLEFMDAGRAYARAELGHRGILYPVAIGPNGWDIWRGYDKPDRGLFYGQKSNALFCAANMVMRFDYTRDRAYARKVYPFLVAVADFWEDELRLEGDRYVVRGDNLGEAAPESAANGHCVNPIITVGLLHQFLRGMLDISEELGADADRRSRWADMLARLSPLPTLLRDGVRRFAGAESGPWSDKAGFEYIWAGQGIAWPSGVVGLSSGADTLEVARREGIPYPLAGPPLAYRGNHTVFPYAARVGMDGEQILRKLGAALEATGCPNLFIHEDGADCIETLSCVPATINEMMLQCHQGVVRVFPVWPRTRPARFVKLRTHGAFLVSAELSSGKVASLRITSERGRPLCLDNPWPGSALRVVDAATGRGVPVSPGPGGAQQVAFRTRAGRTYSVLEAIGSRDPRGTEQEP